MRLRTLPVSISGVLGGICVAVAYGFFYWAPALVCLLFALAAQIASNFANEYFDFVKGLDKAGREGFRRGVAEGDITPRAMMRATLIALCTAGLLGLILLFWGGLWLLVAGAVILCGAIAYSGGPWPLSHHGLGDAAVILFYGLVPVFFTAWLQACSASAGFPQIPPGQLLTPWLTSLLCGLAIGLMGMNVLIVNNYRDEPDDQAVGKRTTAVIFGRRAMLRVYYISWILADILLWICFQPFCTWVLAAGICVLADYQYILWRRIGRLKGSALNPMLKKTSLTILASVGWCLVNILFNNG